MMMPYDVLTTTWTYFSTTCKVTEDSCYNNIISTHVINIIFHDLPSEIAWNCNTTYWSTYIEHNLTSSWCIVNLSQSPVAQLQHMCPAAIAIRLPSRALPYLHNGKNATNLKYFPLHCLCLESENFVFL